MSLQGSLGVGECRVAMGGQRPPNPLEGSKLEPWPGSACSLWCPHAGGPVLASQRCSLHLTLHPQRRSLSWNDTPCCALGMALQLMGCQAQRPPASGCTAPTHRAGQPWSWLRATPLQSSTTTALGAPCAGATAPPGAS